MILSCGMLLYKFENEIPKFLLVHPGGDYNKHAPWGIPKGIKDDEDETCLECALREFEEETGFELNLKDKLIIDMGCEYNPRSGKNIQIYALEHDIDVSKIVSNTCFVMVHGRRFEVPEIDEGRWFTYEECIRYCGNFQIKFITRLNKFFKGMAHPVYVNPNQTS